MLLSNPFLKVKHRFDYCKYEPSQLLIKAIQYRSEIMLQSFD